MTGETILLTGATGFLGMEILVRVLGESEGRILAPVRAADQATADVRIDELLARVEDHPPAGWRERIHGLPADLTSPGLGLSPADRARVVSETDCILHCAASIAFDLPLEEARGINTVGTARVLDLAREVAAHRNLRRVLHVSTAYVSGRHAGDFAEDDLDCGQAFRNTYERTKQEAEQLLATADDLPLAIARPSIVVGESDSGWTPVFNVVYFPLRAFARGLLERVPADPDGIVDIVPVDYVADGLVHLLRSPTANGTYAQVGGAQAPTVADLIALACSRFGRPLPRLVPPGREGLIEGADLYVPYFDVSTRFDDQRARAELGAAGIVAPLVADYLEPVLAYAERSRWGKRSMTRAAARATVQRDLAA